MKYAPLGDHLKALPASQAELTLRFDQVEKIIGDPLPPSAFKHREWWANQDSGSRAPHWDSAGFKVDHADLERRIVRFRRIVPRRLLLQEVVTEINARAQGRPIGNLQEWRKTNRAFTRLPSSTLFYASVEDGRDWHFHVGELSELQFNVGFESFDSARIFRYGVAFSLQPTREMPVIDPMVPRIAKFNEFLRIYPDFFEGLQMWHWRPDGMRSPNYAVAPIPDELIRTDMFIFIGAVQCPDAIDVDQILDDFDRLLPLYEYVEGTEAFPREDSGRSGFQWSPGSTARAPRTSYERPALSVDRALQHNTLQAALCAHLQEIHGFENVRGELNCGTGAKVDAAVKRGDTYVYYEIKTGQSARSCIREALGQLLEYSFWPGAQEASRLVIVGEAPYDGEAKAYIERLRKDFSLPLEYQRFDLSNGRLARN